MTGFILIDKPKGITSHDVVDRIRDLSGEKRVGHGGTLDPLATGLLVVGVGREATKRLSLYTQGKDKVYVAEIFLGKETDTDDAEGRVITTNTLVPSFGEVRQVLDSFAGTLAQKVPLYSAVKVRGNKLYNLARKGKKIDTPTREIKIYYLKLIGYDYPLVVIEVKVSSGTYIRALARDIGIELGCGAYLANLRRIAIGEFNIANAVNLASLTKDNWSKLLIT